MIEFSTSVVDFLTCNYLIAFTVYERHFALFSFSSFSFSKDYQKTNITQSLLLCSSTLWLVNSLCIRNISTISIPSEYKTFRMFLSQIDVYTLREFTQKRFSGALCRLSFLFPKQASESSFSHYSDNNCV